MIHRILAMLVTAGYLAGQLAVVPHAHGDSSAGAQGSGPHLHLSWLVPGSHADEHRHHHPHRHEATDSTDVVTLADAGHDHDADAVYAPLGVSVGQPAGHGKAKLSLSRHLAHSQPSPSGILTDGGPQSLCAVALPRPRGAPPGCELILILRTLRI